MSSTVRLVRPSDAKFLSDPSPRVWLVFGGGWVAFHGGSLGDPQGAAPVVWHLCVVWTPRDYEGGEFESPEAAKGPAPDCSCCRAAGPTHRSMRWSVGWARPRPPGEALEALNPLLNNGPPGPLYAQKIETLKGGNFTSGENIFNLLNFVSSHILSRRERFI